MTRNRIVTCLRFDGKAGDGLAAQTKPRGVVRSQP